MNNQMGLLEEQRQAFTQRRFLAMPMAGMIVWTIIGFAGTIFSDLITIWVLFIGTGSIVYLGMFISKFTGENFMDSSKPKNTFDTLFFLSTGMAVLVYSIAIPFFMVDHTSLPLSVGILTGLMWMPFSWIIQHWVGIFHSVSRTLVIVIAWYLFPAARFILIPFVIVAIYAISFVILEERYKKVNGHQFS